MKHLVMLTAALFAFSCEAEARFNPPDNYVGYQQREALRQIGMYDKDNDGRLDEEEFMAKTGAKVTRETRRQIRRAKKDGVYQAPNEQFKVIDADGDGYLTYQEMEKYISEQIRKSNGKIDYY
ncbi:MAG: EF-hand domain-containing protein [Alphaproteobacteria bacterium]|nr:EF-hand domain-containing protein [Alphaproteobacteria bacterium]